MPSSSLAISVIVEYLCSVLSFKHYSYQRRAEDRLRLAAVMSSSSVATASGSGTSRLVSRSGLSCHTDEDDGRQLSAARVVAVIENRAKEVRLADFRQLSAQLQGAWA